MQPRVSSAAVALALAVTAIGLPTAVDARPMHAAIVDKYHRYLAEKETVSAELEEWLKVYGPKGPKNGYIPVNESRSADDALEDQRQRFYLTKEQIFEAREANPMAEFGTDGPFTLMTMEEFKDYLSNEHVSNHDNTDAPKTDAPKTNDPQIEKPKPETLSDDNNNAQTTIKNNNDDDKKNKDNKSGDGDNDKKTWAPATEGPLVISMVRRLRNEGKSQYAFDKNTDYSTNGESYQSTSDTYTQTSQQTQQTYQSETYQSNTANSGSSGGHQNDGWNFGALSTGDSAQVAGVSSTYNTGNTWSWWGVNGWGGNNTWWGGNNWWGGKNNWGTGSSNSQWTPPQSGSSNSQWTPPDNQWTQPPSTDNNEQEAPAPQAPSTPAPTSAPTTPRPTKAPVTNAPAPVAPATPATKAPATAAPVTKKKKLEASEDTSTDARAAADSDSDSVDWSTSACVNPPSLQGQCGSCWAFATIGALEAAQCIANGDKKAPNYSEQQLVSCDTKDFGCNGGAPVYAMEYLRDNGICTDASYPYTEVDGGTAAACTKSCTPTKSGITEIAQIPAGDETALLSAVKQQPVIASVISDNTAWKQYMSGVITACPSATVDHAVLVVGYDATTIKIKNSWGTDWGEDGYVRISRSSAGMGTCGVLTDMSYPKL
ncbi:unnamed protein product [Phytophthora lilii]|uniref:Unnamed protein product n=1 Tax=Phytophthora lilii TaxID=2077276 RepID=A0A9W6WRN4_9STRA|nr:unnamed protein product [Phytophthora lilii]